MTDWALVIGIDGYAPPTKPLRGAVRDALAMRTWLIEQAKVPRQNVILALAPSTATPSEVSSTGCTYAELVKAINHVVNRSGGAGDRLFFYFSGHGVEAKGGLRRSSPAIVASDFDPILTTNSISIDSILSFFEGTSFTDQFFFFDACRNLPWDGNFEAGRMPRDPQCAPPKVAPQRFVCHATSRGVKAAEVKYASFEGGAFTQTLLRGLQGDGDATLLDLESTPQRSVVRWNSLFGYVKEGVERLGITFPDAPDLIQVPQDDMSRKGVLNRDNDPILWSADLESLAAVRLEVQIGPAAVAPLSEVSVYAVGELVPLHVERNPPSTPIHIDLRPNNYAVRANAEGYRSTKPKWLLELKGPRTLSVDFEVSAPTRVLRGRSIDAADRNIDDAGLIGAIRTSAGPTKLVIQVPDPLVLWEVLTPGGEVVARARGSVHLVVKPGAYRLRLVLPEQAVPGELVEVTTGRTEMVEPRLAAPTLDSAFGQIAQEAGFHVGTEPSHPTILAEELGATLGTELSTMLVLGATVSKYTEQMTPSVGRKLRNLMVDVELDSLRSAGLGSGVALAIGDERPLPLGVDAAAMLADTGVRLSGRASPPSPRLAVRVVRDKPPIAVSSVPVAPGNLWLSLDPPGVGRVSIPISALHGRVMLIVAHGMPSGDIGMYLYAPSLVVENKASVLVADLRHTREVELVQRYMLRGRFDYLADPESLTRAQPDDPIGQILAAYLLLRRGEVEAASRIATALATTYPGWADPELVRAEAYAISDNSDMAREGYRRTLDCGLPMFAGGLARLGTGVERLRVQHASVPLLRAAVARRVPGVLWTTIAGDEDSLQTDVRAFANQPGELV